MTYKTVLKNAVYSGILFSVSTLAYAQQSLASSVSQGIVETIIYSVIGIIMAAIGFKVVDWITPGNLAEEVSNNQNRALAILAGSMIIGVCLIIAAVLVG